MALKENNDLKQPQQSMLPKYGFFFKKIPLRTPPRFSLSADKKKSLKKKLCSLAGAPCHCF
jgi:hypothetical protein